MKKQYTILVALLIMSCSNNENPANSNDEDIKSEALEFALKVVKSYIENDTTAYESFLPDTLYFTEYWEEPIPSSQINVSYLFSQFDYSDYSMDDYYENYSPEIHEYEEYKEWFSNLVYWHPDSQDYLFVGSKVKEGKEEFMWDDLLGFIVSQRSGSWKIRAM